MGALWPGRKAEAGVCAVGCGLWWIVDCGKWKGGKGWVLDWMVVGNGGDVECFIEGRKERL